MSDIIIGYHATNANNVQSIINGNFRKPQKAIDNSDEKVSEKFYTYWLGSGIYFFEDIEVAKWWKTKPSSTFGENGSYEDKAIIKAMISTSSRTWDLRKVTTWRKVIKAFDEYMTQIGKYIVNTSNSSNELKKDLYKKLRCSFFTWFSQSYNVDVIIVAFNQIEFNYLDKGFYDIGEYMDIFYTEVQYCVYDINCIKQRCVAKEDA